MIVPIKRLILTESVNTFSRKIMQTMVHLRKPFKKYGSPLPRKPDISSISSVSNISNHFNQDKSGPGQLFDYHELLRDSRPARAKMVG